MIVIFDEITCEFLSDIENMLWGGFYFSSGWKEDQEDSNGNLLIEAYMQLPHGDPTLRKASFSTIDEARKLALNLKEEFLRGGDEVNFFICDLSIVEEKTTRGGRIIEVKNWASATVLESITEIPKPPKEESKTDIECAVEKIMLNELSIPLSYYEESLHMTKKFISSLKNEGYEIVKRRES